MFTRQERQTAFSGNCKKCGGRTECVFTLPKDVGNPGYDIYKCLDCEFIDWLPTSSHSDPPALGKKRA
jgi:hypothetical protein